MGRFVQQRLGGYNGLDGYNGMCKSMMCCIGLIQGMYLDRMYGLGLEVSCSQDWPRPSCWMIDQTRPRSPGQAVAQALLLLWSYSNKFRRR